MQTILVLAAHPDDEVLGCGGTIANFCMAGSDVHAAFFSDGIAARSNEIEITKVEARKFAAKKACNLLGVKSTTFFSFPDNAMDSIPLIDLVTKIEALILKYRPSIIFTHSDVDINVDHRRVHDATMVACRPQTDHPVKTILCFEIPSSTEWQVSKRFGGFTPNWFVDISSTLGVKLEALNAYEVELRKWPHPRSVEGVGYLAKWRGATIGVDAAEAFTLGRHLG